MFERVLVPLDGSTFGEFALPIALDIVRRTEGRIELVNVHDPLPAFPEELTRELSVEEASGRYLEEVLQRLRRVWDGDADFRVMRGPVVECLVAAADDVGADLVVMATHGRGPLSRFWLGSVADGFVRTSHRPVLLVRPRKDETPELTEAPEFRQILVPMDRTQDSLSVVQEAVAMAHLHGSSFLLTTVIHRPVEYVDPYVPEATMMTEEWMEEAEEKARERLESEAERMRARDLEVTVEVVRAHTPAAGILEVAEASGSDLIAMGTHGRTGVPRLVLGSVADKVVRGSEVPVLLYRPPEA